MADTKVSALSNASTLDGTEKFHGVQSSTDKAISGLQMAELAFARLERKRFSKLVPILGSTSWTIFGAEHWHPGNIVFSGNNSGTSVFNTSYITRLNYAAFVTSASAGTLAYFIPTAASSMLSIGGSGVGGFRLVGKWFSNHSVTDARFFFGLTNSTSAPTNVEPNTLTNCIGVAKLAGSANIQIVYGGSAAQTAIDLGANFPANGAKTNLYEFEFFSDPNDNTQITYRVERNPGQSSNNYVATGTITNTTPGTTLPATTTFLGPRFWICNNATASAAEMDLVSLACITDN